MPAKARRKSPFPEFQAPRQNTSCPQLKKTTRKNGDTADNQKIWGNRSYHPNLMVQARREKTPSVRFAMRS
jgi:hypothetical protein